jgi:Fe-S cluster biogenesis protein NfuA
MAADDGLAARSDRLEVLLRECDAQQEASSRERIREVVRLLLELHREGLLRMLALAGDPAVGGATLIGRLADDPLVGPLLLIHQAHPYPVAARLDRALERMRAWIAAHGCRATLEGIDGDAARVRLEGGARLSDRSAVVQRIEAELTEAAPELARVVVVPQPEAAAEAPPLLQIMRAPPVVREGS